MFAVVLAASGLRCVRGKDQDGATRCLSLARRSMVFVKVPEADNQRNWTTSGPGAILEVVVGAHGHSALQVGAMLVSLDVCGARRCVSDRARTTKVAASAWGSQITGLALLARRADKGAHIGT